jgi:hypothetical protein
MKIVDLEDRGQDFTSFYVDDDNVITDAVPFQGWVWSGFRIHQKRIRVGMKLRMAKGAQRIVLRYAVVGIRPGDGQ